MKRLRNQNGFVYVITLSLLGLLLGLVVAVSAYSFSLYGSARNSQLGLSALSVADAAAEKYINDINKNDANCPAIETNLFNDTKKGRGTWQCEVTGTEAVFTGRIYAPQNATKASVTRKVKIRLSNASAFGTWILAADNSPHVDHPAGNTNANAAGAIFAYCGKYDFFLPPYDGRIHANQYISLKTSVNCQDKVQFLGGEIFVTGHDPNPTWSPNLCSIAGLQGELLSLPAIYINNEAYRKITEPKCGSHLDFGPVGDPLKAANGISENQTNPKVELPSIPFTSPATNTACNDIDIKYGNGPSAYYQIKNTHYPNNSGGTCNVVFNKHNTYVIKGNAHIHGDVTVEKGVDFQVDDSITNDVIIRVSGTISFTSGGGGGQPKNCNNCIQVTDNAAGSSVIFWSDSNTNNVTGSETGASAIKITCDSGAGAGCMQIDLGYLYAPNGSIHWQTDSGSFRSIAAKNVILHAKGDNPETTFSPPKPFRVIYYQRYFR